jgi:Na+-transporting methylmalonyl-CoA/oxaloacetate decarboxylase gamma subunit
MSERYARWFGTRVPSTSPMLRYMILLVVATPWALTCELLFTTPIMNSLFIFILSCGVGVVFYSLYLFILQKRFCSQITNEKFFKIVESAQERVGSNSLVHVWQRKSHEPYIASSFNFLFNAVIVSETMIDLILEKPVSGEALLAFHLLQKQSHRYILDIIAATLMFSVFSTLLAQIPFAYLSTLPLYLLIQLFYYLFGAILLVPIAIILLRSASWTHDSAFERAFGMYKIHPQVAKDEVLSSTTLDEEAAKSVVWIVKEWERNKRASRRSSITAVILIIIYLFSVYLLAQTMWYYYSFSSIVYLLVLTIPLIIALIVYIFLRRWDKKCMGELYYGTTQADEPIWVD